ncbi:hypothetical protein CRG98_037836 [Punica granatum]|uniref:Retrovirus-related Pol polyprotein from transposon TNT 1-94-like beta-barrel domain-containing protein n=1 Tax=Punica granatum TaxID=22663 RepID=A0A2I0ID93_PUNGR|nr:hypothetical protein CRG98_037836 [Punica granatum]
MATEVITAFKVMNQEFVKLNRFDGTNFNRWKDKMLFLLTVLNVALCDLKVIILESLQVEAIISKLPLSWNDYRKKLLYMMEEFTVEKIFRHLRIEEEIQKRDAVYLPQGSKVNHEKDATDSKANVVEDMDFVAMVTGGIKSLEIDMITELNIAMTDKSYNWWLDSGVTVHVCNDRQQFKSYEPVANREVHMGNHQSVKVLDQGTVELNFTSGKKLTLINVLHVPYIRKNLLSTSLLCNKGFKDTIEKIQVDSEQEYEPMISSDQNKRHLCDNKNMKPRKSQSMRKEKDFGPDFISSQSRAYLVEGDRESVIRKIPIMVNVEGDPQTYGETMASRDAAFWKETINDEMDSILFNNTWVLVDLPQ